MIIPPLNRNFLLTRLPIKQVPSLAFAFILILAGCKSSGIRKNPDGILPADEFTLEGDPKKKEQVDFLFIEGATQNMQGNPKAAYAQFEEVTKLDAANSAAWYNMAKISFEQQDYREAIRLGKQALTHDKENFWYYALLADAYERLMDHNNAIGVLRELTEKFPEHRESWLNLSEIYRQSGQFDAAIETLDRFAKLVGVYEEILFRKFRIAMVSGNRILASELVSQLIAINPYQADYRRSAYEMHMANGDTSAAFHELQTMLEISPADPFALFTLADHYRRSGKESKSNEYIFRAFESPDVPLASKIEIISGLYPLVSTDPAIEARVKKLAKIILDVHRDDPAAPGAVGEVYLQLQQPDSARIFIRASLAEDATNLQVWAQLLQIDLYMEEFQALEKDAEKAMEYFPDHLSFLYYYGVGNSRNGNDDVAIYSFERIRKIGNDQLLAVQACINLGEIFNRQGKFTAADENMDAALKISPRDPTVLNNYSWYLALRKDRLDEAEGMIKSALQFSPDFAAYLDTYGWVLYQKGDFENAEKQLRKAAVQHEDAEILEHLGDTLNALDRREEAEEYWKKALDKGGKFKLQDKQNQSTDR